MKQKKGYPKLRTGEGYSTAGREQFDNSVSVLFDYGQVSIGIDTANKIAAEYFQKVSKDFEGSLRTPKNKIMSATSKSKGNFKSVQLFPGDFKDKIDGDIKQIGIIIADEMKKEIKGVIKTAPGARGAGRIDTGTMIDSVYGRRTKYNKSKGVLEVSAGWLDLWYKYFGFQEQGTRTGIKPMRAIAHTAMVTFPEAYKITRMYTANFGKRVGFKGRFR